MPRNISVLNTLSRHLSAYQLAREPFAALQRICARGQDQTAGIVRTGRGVVQRHVRDQDLAQIGALLLPQFGQKDAGLICSAAWVSEAGAGHFHNWHWHTGCTHSAIVYFDRLARQPGRCGETKFRTAPGAATSFYVCPQPGLALFFDAALPHKTIPTVSGFRRTLAIDFLAA